MSPFEKTGMYPPNAEPAFARVLKEQQKSHQAIDPASSSLLPREQRFQIASDMISGVRQRFDEVLSFPTREGLRFASKVAIEASALESQVKAFLRDRNQRVEALANRRKRGKQVKPSGQFITSVSLAEIRKQQVETIAAEIKKENKRQLRNSRVILRQEIEP